MTGAKTASFAAVATAIAAGAKRSSLPPLRQSRGAAAGTRSSHMTVWFVPSSDHVSMLTGIRRDSMAPKSILPLLAGGGFIAVTDQLLPLQRSRLVTCGRLITEGLGD